ncbi:MAG: response regulator transcription factor [Rikenellaceae bacterium]|nr:response regulator transcription factor [Rikenellaceae bacterium]
MRDFIIADNQEITRKGLEALLAELEVAVGRVIFCSDRRTIADCLQGMPDAVVIFDYTLLDFYGAEQLLNLASRYERSSWIVFSEELGKAFVRTICSHGRVGIVMKGDTMAEISEAILCAYNYGVYLCESAHRMVEEAGAGQNAEKLTVSELSILREIALGRTTKEIAAGRCLSFHTVNSHRKNIFRKLGVNNLQEAIRYALRAGLIDMADYSI